MKNFEDRTIIYLSDYTLQNFLDLYDNWNGNLVINDEDCNHYATVNFSKLTTWLCDHTDVANAKVMAFGFYDGELCVRVDV